jgi:hypothetical protein
MSFAQPGSEDKPCEAKWLNDFVQLTDSIQFNVECWTPINFKNDVCSWVLAEDYMNTVPQETTSVLCVIYFKNQLQADEIEFIKLFDEPNYRKKYLKRIQLIFVYDTKTGFNEAFQGQKEIEKLFNHDIRKGFEKRE